VIFAISCSYMEAVLVFSNQRHEVTTTRAGLGWGYVVTPLTALARAER